MCVCMRVRAGMKRSPWVRTWYNWCVPAGYHSYLLPMSLCLSFLIYMLSTDRARKPRCFCQHDIKLHIIKPQLDADTSTQSLTLSCAHARLHTHQQPCRAWSPGTAARPPWRPPTHLASCPEQGPPLSSPLIVHSALDPHGSDKRRPRRLGMLPGTLPRPVQQQPAARCAPWRVLHLPAAPAREQLSVSRLSKAPAGVFAATRQLWLQRPRLVSFALLYTCHESRIRACC